MTILGLLLVLGGGWIIQDDITSRHHLRKVNSGLPGENDEFIFHKVKQLFSKPHFTTSWRLHYETEIREGLDNRKLTKLIPGYYSIFSDQNQWINYGCVSLGTMLGFESSKVRVVCFSDWLYQYHD